MRDVVTTENGSFIVLEFRPRVQHLGANFATAAGALRIRLGLEQTKPDKLGW